MSDLHLSLDRLANLDDNKFYHLSNDGEIKESGFWHSVKCFFHIGNAREQSANLIQAIKVSLIDAAGKAEIREVNNALSDLHDVYGIDGEAIKNLTREFRVTNSNTILKHSAKSIAARVVHDAMLDLEVKSGQKIKPSQALSEFLLSGASKFILEPPIQNRDGIQTVDESSLKQHLQDRLDELKNKLIEIRNSKELGDIKFTSSYLDYLKDTLLDKEGKLTDVDVSELQSSAMVYADKIQKLVGNPHNSAEENQLLAQTAGYLISQLQDDQDAEEIMMSKKVCKSLLMGGDGKARSLDSVKSKIAALKSNLDELRLLAGDNTKLFNSYKKLMIGMLGKSAPQGVFTKLVTMCKQVNLDAFKNLSPQSSNTELRTAVIQFAQSVNNIMNQSMVIEEAKLEGKEDTMPYTDLIVSSLLGTLNAEQRMSIMNTLQTVKAMKLTSVLSRFENRQNIKLPLLQGARNEKLMAKLLARGYSYMMDQIKVSLAVMMGRPPLGVSYYVGEVNEEKEFPGLISQLRPVASDEVNRRIDDFIKHNFKGQLTQGYKDILKAKMLSLYVSPKVEFEYEQFQAHEAFKMLTTKDIKTLLDTHLPMEMKKYATKQLSTFEKDVVRDLDVSLPNGQKLSKEPAEAYDQLAAVLSGKEGQKYAELSAQSQKQVQLLTVFFSQEAIKANQYGYRTALSEKRDRVIHEVIGEKGTNQSNFSIRKDEDGDFTIEINYKKTFHTLLHPTEGELEVDRNSSEQSKVKVIISQAELDRLSEVDFSAYDEQQIQQIMAENVNKENYLDEVDRNIPAQFKGNFAVDPIDYTLEVKEKPAH